MKCNLLLGKRDFTELIFFSEVKLCMNKVKETKFFCIFVVLFCKSSPNRRVNLVDKGNWSAFITACCLECVFDTVAVVIKAH